MIKSFRGDAAEAVWQGRRIRSVSPELAKASIRKLAYLDAARTLADLRVPPANRLETLKGSRKGQYSIRVNDQYRICFIWCNGDAFDVELTDYH